MVKATKTGYERGSFMLAYGNTPVLAILFPLAYLFTGLVTTLGVYLHYNFLLALRSNTDYLVELLELNQVEKVERAGALFKDSDGLLIEGNYTMADVASSINGVFLYRYEDVIFQSLDTVSYFQSALPYMMSVVLFFALHGLEVLMVRSRSLTHTSYKENKLAHFHPGYRLLKVYVGLVSIISTLLFLVNYYM